LKPRLVELEPGAGRQVELEGRMTVGRDPCEITLEDDQVSRRHARIEVRGGSVTLDDLGSRNGTYLNDVQVREPSRLRDGDVIRMGATVWRFEAPAAPPPPSAPDPGHLPRFQPSEAPQRRGPAPARASAARRVEATMISFAIVATTAVAVIAYLAAR
jgi:predicted component of type VI protein secretion system